MSYLVQPELVNEPFADAGLFLDFRFGRRALLFDLGELTVLPPRKILRISDVFVSHLHMDHFAGFDRLLRLHLYRPNLIRLSGPTGLGDAVEAKLRAYSWNLLGPDSADLELAVTEWGEAASGRITPGAGSLFRAREAFRRRPLTGEPKPPTRLLDEPEFFVEGAVLDHGIPSLAFAFQEKRRVNVHKESLALLDLAIGPWLTPAKRALRREDPPETCIQVSPDRRVTLDALQAAGVLRVGRGQRVTYVTDLACTPANLARLTALAAGSDHLFIEAPFLDADREEAAQRRHLTAAQAGRIAGQASAARATPFHFSARYLDREAELRREFEDSFAAARSTLDIALKTEG